MLETIFHHSTATTLGMELEVQLVDRESFDLVPHADPILHMLAQSATAKHFQQEVTCAMLELNSGVHQNSHTLLPEMQQLAKQLGDTAEKVQTRPCGGGTHVFQDWRQRQITDLPRYKDFAEHYGYLARQFTVFGQHVHIGCKDGDTAIWLCHALAYYVPHMIALSASSPFLQSEDSSFASARSNMVSAFPMSGHMPPSIRNWKSFQEHVKQLHQAEIIQSLKDLYWDIRPKPEYGTVEIRVFDTPLDITHSVALSAFCQTLVHYLLAERPQPAGRAALYCVYPFNRFQAARFGMHARLHDVRTGKRQPLSEQILQILALISPYATDSTTRSLLNGLAQRASQREGDYQRLRALMQNQPSAQAVIAAACDLWYPATQV